jgi:hypothetical protein
MQEEDSRPVARLWAEVVVVRERRNERKRGGERLSMESD